MELIQLQLGGTRSLTEWERKLDENKGKLAKSLDRARLEIFLYRDEDQKTNKGLCFTVIVEDPELQLDGSIEMQDKEELIEFRNFINRKIDELLGKDPLKIDQNIE